MNIPAAESIYTTKYQDFKGVDFTSQICSRQRFPKAKNFIISDMVEKRPGWKVLKNFEGLKINGLYLTIINNIQYYLVHAGDKLYSMTDFNAEPVLLLEEINNAKSSGFYANNCYYILTGEEYIEFDGKKCNVIDDEFYTQPYEVVFNTLYKLDENYDKISSWYNYISNDSFTLPGSTEEYKIVGKKLISGEKSIEIKNVKVSEYSVRYNVFEIEGEIYSLSCTFTNDFIYPHEHYDYYSSHLFYDNGFAYSCKFKNDLLKKLPVTYVGAKSFGSNSGVPDGGWDISNIYNNISVKDKERNLLFGYNVIEYPSYSQECTINGGIYWGFLLPSDAADNATCILEFSDGSTCVCSANWLKISWLANAKEGADEYINLVHTRMEGASGPFRIYYETKNSNQYVYKSTISNYIQYGNGVYYFFAGNKTHPNRDWQSDLNNPMYIKSDKYTIYGTEDEILGYGQYGEYLAVFKKGNIDTNIYIRSVQDLGELGIAFPTSIGVGGAIGGLTQHTILNMDGETLYLTNQGIYALTSLSLTNMKVTRNRSYFIDGLLLKEENLQNAVACTWKQKYFLCVNSRCYILDGTQSKKYLDSTNNEYAYECLYWDNIPATSFLSTKDKLYFGTDDGRICVFTENEYYDGDKPTEMLISTVLDDDGDFMALKKMKKKGTGILVKPYLKSSFDISFVYDTYAETKVKTAYADIFNFNDIDFERFAFETSENPRIIPFLKKSKKYKSIQIILKSTEPEPFGILEIVKRFTFNNYVKRS